ncbi:MAG: hypothetical protein CVU86_08640 [Firmicutes bacterium HGW-Firmicutes-11]|nr:MAG: hypothetical protein CVU86_08640 [Firmicutes bacterium HGW-Firmicutes-11]
MSNGIEKWPLRGHFFLLIQPNYLLRTDLDAGDTESIDPAAFLLVLAGFLTVFIHFYLSCTNSI